MYQVKQYESNAKFLGNSLPKPSVVGLIIINKMNAQANNVKMIKFAKVCRGVVLNPNLSQFNQIIDTYYFLIGLI